MHTEIPKDFIDHITIRKATFTDIPQMQEFIFEHGKNSWNFLPEKEVKAHIKEIAAQKVFAFLAEREHECVGFVSAYFGIPAHCQKYIDQPNNKTAYLSEIVVHHDYVGLGIGSGLINTLKEFLIANYVVNLYTERHTDNPGSTGVMVKTGFKIIDEYHDPARRPDGSQKTTVVRLDLNGNK